MPAFEEEIAALVPGSLKTMGPLAGRNCALELSPMDTWTDRQGVSPETRAEREQLWAQGRQAKRMSRSQERSQQSYGLSGSPALSLSTSNTSPQNPLGGLIMWS